MHRWLAAGPFESEDLIRPTWKHPAEAIRASIWPEWCATCPAIYSTLDLLVPAVVREGFNTRFLEAAAMGLQVVATRIRDASMESGKAMTGWAGAGARRQVP